MTKHKHPPDNATGSLHPEELEICKKQCQEYLNNWKRAEADFINYRKDEKTRNETLLKFSNERILMEAIDILDALDEAIKHIPKGTDTSWLSGIEQIAKKFHDLLMKHGVKRIETEQKPFDPMTMEAVQTKPPNISEQSGIVESEIRAGYLMHGRVIRPARVSVYQ